MSVGPRTTCAETRRTMLFLPLECNGDLAAAYRVAGSIAVLREVLGGVRGAVHSHRGVLGRRAGLGSPAIGRGHIDTIGDLVPRSLAGHHELALSWCRS